MQSDAPPSLPVNHVFVDFENLKTIDGDTAGNKPGEPVKPELE